MIAAVGRMAAAESLTRKSITQRLAAETDPLSFEYLNAQSVALKRKGVTFKRNRLRLEKAQPGGIRRETGRTRQSAAGRL